METEKAIELIEKSERLALFLPQEQNLDTLAAAEVLVRILTSRNKQVGLFSPVPGAFEKPEIFTHLTKPLPVTKEFIISLYTQDSPISQLRYEKSDDKLDIIISPQGAPLEERLISFRQGKILCDAAILLGIKEVENISGNTDIPPDFFTETSLINIDISLENKKYGEANLVSTEKLALSEIIYNLASLLQESPLAKESATLLLAGILEKTDNLNHPQINADTLLAASELLRLDADLPYARSLAFTTKPMALLQLLGRASVRSRMDQEKSVLWSFLTLEDFEKTLTTPLQIKEVLRHLEQTFPPRKIVALLWQEDAENKISAALSGGLQILSALSAEGQGELKSSFLKLSSSFHNFRDGEEYVRSLLDRVL